MTTVFYSKESFHNAQLNMEYDAYLVKKLARKKYDFFMRFYEWQHPGITITEKKHLPENLHHLDHFWRPTGGGIVFHSPGDCVFSMGLLSTLIPKNMTSKELLSILSEWLGNVLESLHLKTVTRASETNRNLQFCNGYFNPYERYLKNIKCIALAMKKRKDMILIQGVIHITPNTHVDMYKALDTHYHRFFTKGLEGYKISASMIQEQCLSNIPFQFL